MHTSTTLTAGAALLIGLTSIAAPGHASVADQDRPAAVQAPSSSAPVGLPGSTSTQITPDSNDQAAVMAKLKSLVGTQTPQELAAIESSGQPAQLLADAHGNTIAGYIDTLSGIHIRPRP